MARIVGSTAAGGQFDLTGKQTRPVDWHRRRLLPARSRMCAIPTHDSDEPCGSHRARCRSRRSCRPNVEYQRMGAAGEATTPNVFTASTRSEATVLVGGFKTEERRDDIAFAGKSDDRIGPFQPQPRSNFTGRRDQARGASSAAPATTSDHVAGSGTALVSTQVPGELSRVTLYLPSEWVLSSAKGKPVPG